MNSSNSLFCENCGNSVSQTANFCQACGHKIKKSLEVNNKTKKTTLYTLLSLSIIFVFAWLINSYLIGKRPTEELNSLKEQPSHSKESFSNDPELVALRNAAEKNPTDKAGWALLGNALAKKIMSTQKPSPDLIFESLSVLRKILDIDPKDSDALFAMAEISFNQQAFSKAVEFYSKYLENNPNDLDTKARLASAMTFVGNFEEALKILNEVLLVKPDHFHALAYSAVNYAEMGEKEKAIKIGEEAISLAPNDEAKDRFTDFIESVKSKDFKDNKNLGERGTSPNTKSVSISPANLIVDAIKQNPVAGKKFAGYDFENKILRLKFNNFPMDQMPPFIKDKFLNSIKTNLAATKGEVVKVQIVEETDNKIMAEVLP